MKTLISALLMMLIVMVSFSACSQSTASTAAANDATVTQNVKISGPVAVESAITQASDGTKGKFLAENWGALFLGLLGFYDVIARLTPTTKDNSIVSFLTTLYNALVPNLKKGGGKL